jgi:hypothetical protein
MVTGGTLNSTTNKTFKILSILKKCREKGKYDLDIKLINKYNINKRKLQENYYD